MVFIFSGIVWAQLTRRAHSIRIPPSVGEEARGSSGVEDERADSAELEDEFHDISSFGIAGESKRGARVSQRGVRAIFSSDEDWSTRKHDGSRTLGISKTLLNLMGWGLFLVVYALLVQEYSSNVYMQSWIRTKFGFGAYLLNYYTLLVVATVAGFLLFRLLFLKWRQVKTLRLD